MEVWQEKASSCPPLSCFTRRIMLFYGEVGDADRVSAGGGLADDA